jgi:hypothetical protein
MATRRLASLVVGLMLLLPASARATENDVVAADRLAAELGSRIARALKVQVTVEPDARAPLIMAAGPGLLRYNPDAMIRLEQTYGQSAVTGLVAHWIGALKNPAGGPLLAEANAGCAFARIGQKHQGYQQALAAGAFGVSAGPVGPGRTSSLVQGYLNCLMGQEPRVPESAARAARAVPTGPRLAAPMAPFTARASKAKRKR